MNQSPQAEKAAKKYTDWEIGRHVNLEGFNELENEEYKKANEDQREECIKHFLAGVEWQKANNLWDDHSRLIPEDAEGDAEEIAETVAGKRIMFEQDFKEALSEWQKSQEVGGGSEISGYRRDMG